MKKYILPIGCVIVLSVVFVAGQMLASHPAVQPVDAQIPDQAVTIGNWIDQSQNTYLKSQSTVVDLQKQLDAAMQQMTAAHDAAQGYRKALCSQFHMSRDKGQFVPLTDCSVFQ